MKQTLLFCLIIGSLTGCYTPTPVPDSIIPTGCLIGMIERFGENGAYEREVYLYDSFGHLTRHYGQRGNATAANDGPLLWDYRYTYDADHYVTKRTSGTGTSPTVYTYEYEGTPRRIRRISSGTGGDITDYTYEGDRLVRLTSSYDGRPNGTITYTADGRLSRIDDMSGLTYEIAGGLITRVTYSDRTYSQLEYNSAGYEAMSTYTDPVRKLRIVYTYTYDNKPYITDSQLRFRGIPDLPGSGRPGNRTSVRVQTYENNTLTKEETTQYRHSYNSQGLPTGYAATTGERVKYYYPTCTPP